jgi:hypothetical protein
VSFVAFPVTLLRPAEYGIFGEDVMVVFQKIFINTSQHTGFTLVAVTNGTFAR